MARTAKKTKVVMVTAVENVARDTEIRKVGEVAADVVVELPAPDAASTTEEAANGTETEPSRSATCNFSLLVSMP
ncbi:hypothetical protein AJ87_03550 [Rhizobium yanglingense]|nr:hypothetical protein AJ87_03550 [Rhizobium yanglingense]